LRSRLLASTRSSATPGRAKPSTAARSAAQARIREAFAQLSACMRRNRVRILAPGVKRGAGRKAIDTTSPSSRRRSRYAGAS
jgi:hypothetical protein